MTDSAAFDEEVAAIDADLARPRFTLSLQPKLEHAYAKRTDSKRARVIRQWHFVAAAANVACLPLDYSADLLQLGLILRLGLVTPLYLAGLFLLDRGPQWVRNAAATVPLVALVAVAATLSPAASDPHSDRYLMAAGLVIMLANIAVPFTFGQAMAATAASLAMMLAVVFGASPPTPETIALCSFISGASLFSLVVRFRAERSSRNNFLSGLRDEIKSARLVALTKALTQLAETDHLTGLHNRRHLAERLRRDWQHAQEHGDWLGVLMVDIDHFKRFNDAAGHEEGDRCLKSVAGALKHEVECRGQYLARFGGEEFIAVLLGLEPDPALQQAERLRRAIEEMEIPHPGLPDGEQVTVSIGASVLRPSRDNDISDLVAAADKALYDAKANGRNQVASAPVVRLPDSESDEEHKSRRRWRG